MLGRALGALTLILALSTGSASAQNASGGSEPVSRRLIRVPDRHRPRLCSDTPGLKQRARGLQFLGIAPADHDRRAEPSEQRGNRLPKAAAAAGDKRHLSGK